MHDAAFQRPPPKAIRRYLIYCLLKVAIELHNNQSDSMSDASPPEGDGGKSPAKKSGKSAFVAASFAGFASAGAGAFFLAPEPDETQQKIVVESKHTVDQPGPSQHGGAEKGHAQAEKGRGKARKKNEHDSEIGEAAEGKFSVVDGVGIYALDPIVVSIRPFHSVRHLKVAIVVETTTDASEAFAEREARIRDTLNIYLAAVDSSTFEDPMALVRIREQISRRISTVVSPTPVFAVLITDFILT